MQRRYFVNYAGIDRQVYPQGTGKLKYVSQREQDQIFKRKKLSGKLQFINDSKKGITDFNFFAQIELSGNSCAEIKLRIEKFCDAEIGWETEWFGYFSTGSALLFDYDKCLFETNVEVDDIYRCIFDKWEKEYNMFDFDTTSVDPAFPIQVQTMNEYRYCVCDPAAVSFFNSPNIIFNPSPLCDTCPCANDPINCPGNDPAIFLAFKNVTGEIYNTVQDVYDAGWCVVLNVKTKTFSPSNPDKMAWVYRTYWKRAVAVMPCSGGVGGVPPTMPAGWILIKNDCAGSGECTFAKCDFGTSNETFLPIRGVEWIPTMNGIVKELCPSIENISSIFFDYSPDTNDPHYAPGLNYITGQVTFTDHLVISQKSDVIAPTASNPATIGIFTLKQWLQWAREVFNVYWDIITDNSGNILFRMEHYDFYQSQLAIDLNLPQWGPFVKAFNKYSHIKERIPETEKFNWADPDGTKDFVGMPIIYLPPCATIGQEVEHNPEQLSTDLSFIFGNKDLSLEGFVMTAAEQINNALTFTYEIGFLTGVSQLNGHLAWANLHQHYHKYNRYLSSGKMNDISTIFNSWKPNIAQVKQSIPGCCEEIDAEGYVLTELGEKYLQALGNKAYIDKMEQTFTPDMISFDLTYSI